MGTSIAILSLLFFKGIVFTVILLFIIGLIFSN